MAPIHKRLMRTVEATGIACGVSVQQGATVKQEGGWTAISPPATTMQIVVPSNVHEKPTCTRVV